MKRSGATGMEDKIVSTEKGEEVETATVKEEVLMKEDAMEFKRGRGRTFRSRWRLISAPSLQQIR